MSYESSPPPPPGGGTPGWEPPPGGQGGFGLGGPGAIVSLVLWALGIVFNWSTGAMSNFSDF